MQTFEKMNTKITQILMIILAVLLVIFLMVISLTSKDSKDTAVDNDVTIYEEDYVESEEDKVYDKDLEALDKEKLVSTILEETEDAGQEYLDNTLFIGDSNTVRSMMYGHTTWDNVVAAVSMGVQHIPSLKMTYFEGMSNAVTVPDAVEIIQPQRIIITYGTNNFGYAVETFLEKYKTGLDAIKEKWPYADIIINSVPPIDRQRENISITMQVIDKFNKALAEFAQEEGYKFLNSAEALKDKETGFAKKDYTIGDGVHLSKIGMEAMFQYFRTHAYITEDIRPKPLKDIPKRKETPSGIITQDPLAVRGTRILLRFISSDPSLGKVDGEIEQKLKRTTTSSAVTAIPYTENGGVFVGWSCSYGGLSSTSASTVTFTVPQVDQNVTEITIVAHFQQEIAEEEEDETETEETEKEEETEEEIIVPVLKGISLSGTNSLDIGSAAQLTISLNPNGAKADVNTAQWSSSDPSVASVSSSGVVTAISAGSATITCTLNGYTASFAISVKEEADQTCGTVGHTQEGTCPVCGQTFTPPTCGAVGHTQEGTCPVCGQTFAPPTCGAVGHTQEGTCPVCGQSFAPPTCGAVGHTQEGTCPVCGQSFAPPTCGAAGHTQEGTCPVCGQSFTAPPPEQPATEEPPADTPEPTAEDIPAE